MEQGMSTVRDLAGDGGDIAADAVQGATVYLLPAVETILGAAERVPLVGAAAAAVKDFMKACRQMAHNQIYFHKVERLIEIAWMWVAEVDRRHAPPVVCTHLAHVEEEIANVIRLTVSLQHLSASRSSILGSAKGVALSASDERAVDLALDRLNDPVNRLIGALAATGSFAADILKQIHVELMEPLLCDAEWASAFREYFPDTRKAIHEGVDKWRNESRGRLLLILAKFGVGKTTFCSSLVARMKRAGELAGAVMFKYSDTSRTPMAALLSLVFQQAKSNTLLPPFVLHGLKLLKVHHDGFTDLMQVFTLLVVGPLVSLAASSETPRTAPRCIVFDGVDEISSSLLQPFLDFLSSPDLQEQLAIANLRLIISSRSPEEFPGVKQCITASHSVSLVIEQDADNEEDIRNYCAWKLKDMKFPDSITPKAVDIIVKKCQMKFVYLRMIERALIDVVQRLADLPTASTEILEKIVERALKALPVSVNDCFQKYLAQLELRIAFGDGVHGVRSMVWKLLGVLLAAHIPLTISEAAFFLNDNEPSVLIYSEFIDNVFPHDHEDHKFRPCHKSFADWLEKSSYKSLFNDGHKCIVNRLCEYFSTSMLDTDYQVSFPVHRYCSIYLINHLLQLTLLPQAYELVTNLNWLLWKVSFYGSRSPMEDVQKVIDATCGIYESAYEGSSQVLHCLQVLGGLDWNGESRKYELCTQLAGRLLSLVGNDRIDQLRSAASSWLEKHGGLFVVGPTLNRIVGPLVCNKSHPTFDIALIYNAKHNVILTAGLEMHCCYLWAVNWDGHLLDVRKPIALLSHKTLSAIAKNDLCAVKANDTDLLIWHDNDCIAMLDIKPNSNGEPVVLREGDISFLGSFCKHFIVFFCKKERCLCIFDVNTRISCCKLQCDTDKLLGVTLNVQRGWVIVWWTSLADASSSTLSVWDVSSCLANPDQQIPTCKTCSHRGVISSVVTTYDYHIAIAVEGVGIYSWNVADNASFQIVSTKGNCRLFPFSRSFAYCPDDMHAFVCGDDGRYFALNTKSKVVVAVDIALTFVLTLQIDGNLRLWCTRKKKSVLIGANVSNVFVGGRYVFALTVSDRIVVFDTKVLVLMPFDEAHDAISGRHRDSVRQVAQISTTLFATIAFSDSIVRIWDVSNGLCVHVLVTDRPCVKIFSSSLRCGHNWILVRTQSSVFMWRDISERSYSFEKQESCADITGHLQDNSIVYLVRPLLEGICFDRNLHIYVRDEDFISQCIQQNDSIQTDVCIVRDNSFAIIRSAGVKPTSAKKIVSNVECWCISNTHIASKTGKLIQLWNVRQSEQHMVWEHGQRFIESLCFDTNEPNVVIAVCFDCIVLWDFVLQISWIIDTFELYLRDIRYCFGTEFLIHWPDLYTLDPSDKVSLSSRARWNQQGKHINSMATRTIKTKHSSIVRCLVAQDSCVHVVQLFARESNKQCGEIGVFPIFVSIVDDRAVLPIEASNQYGTNVPQLTADDQVVEANPEQQPDVVDTNSKSVDKSFNLQDVASQWKMKMLLILAVLASYCEVQYFGSCNGYALLSYAMLLYFLAQH